MWATAMAWDSYGRRGVWRPCVCVVCVVFARGVCACVQVACLHVVKMGVAWGACGVYACIVCGRGRGVGVEVDI